MDDFETVGEHAAYLDWLDAQDQPVDEDVARSAWTASRAYHRQQAEREIAEAQRRLLARQGLRLLECGHAPSGAIAESCGLNPGHGS